MAAALIVCAVILLGAALWGPIVSHVEQAQYIVIDSNKNIEIRDYAPMLVAEAIVKGKREDAINAGFKILADYIFGNNISKNKISMTAPVTQQENEKISMTAPVMQQGNENEWIVRFVMPSHYMLDTLPKPHSEKVKLLEIPGSRFAVIRFSGTATKESIASHENDLKAFINQKNFESILPPTYAFFNPPWTLPPLRRNEIMIGVKY